MKRYIKKIVVLLVCIGVLTISIFKYNSVNGAVEPYYSEITPVNEYLNVQALRFSEYIEFRLLSEQENMTYAKDGPINVLVIDINQYKFQDSGYIYNTKKNITYSPSYMDGYAYYRWYYSDDLYIDDYENSNYLISFSVEGLAMLQSGSFVGYGSFFINIPLYDFADIYTNGYNDGYEIGYTEAYEIGENVGYNSGYNIGYNEGIEHTEFVTTHWFTGVFDAIQNFFDIQIGGMTLGGIILIPFSITFVWFILRAFRGGGSE